MTSFYSVMDDDINKRYKDVNEKKNDEKRDKRKDFY